MQEIIKEIQTLLLINTEWISVTLEDYVQANLHNKIDLTHYLESTALKEATIIYEQRVARLN
jgi:hypothetical protein